MSILAFNLTKREFVCTSFDLLKVSGILKLFNQIDYLNVIQLIQIFITCCLYMKDHMVILL
jgi:hypothetical protein